MVDSELLTSDDELSKMQLLTARQGTNFRLTDQQFSKVNELWCGTKNDLEEYEYSTEEGRAKLRLHKFRERDRTLVKKAKEGFIRNNGGLFCEVCGFNFDAEYGFSYAEAHHKKPLCKISSGEKTKVSDLAIVCSNCHVAVHHINSQDPWSDLLQIHKNKKAQAER